MCGSGCGVRYDGHKPLPRALGLTFPLGSGGPWPSFYSFPLISLPLIRYREMSDHYRATTGSGELTPLLRLVAGACAGIIAMSATYPLDMVRGRLTVQEGRNGQYRGIVHAARTILSQVGRGGLREAAEGTTVRLCFVG